MLSNIHTLPSIICWNKLFFIWPINRTLSGATTPSQSWSWSNSNKEVDHIPQMSKAGASPSNCLRSYTGQSLRSLTSLQMSRQCILQSQSTVLFSGLEIRKEMFSKNVETFYFIVFHLILFYQRLHFIRYKSGKRWNNLWC